MAGHDQQREVHANTIHEHVTHETGGLCRVLTGWFSDSVALQLCKTEKPAPTVTEGGIAGAVVQEPTLQDNELRRLRDELKDARRETDVCRQAEQGIEELLQQQAEHQAEQEYAARQEGRVAGAESEKDRLDEAENERVRLELLVASLQQQCAAMAQQQPGNSQHDTSVLRSEALALFARADFNGNGVLSHTEIKKEVQNDPAMRLRLSATSWKQFFDAVDSDGQSLTILSVQLPKDTFSSKMLSVQ